MSYVGREVLLCEDGHLAIFNSVNIMNEGWKSVPRCQVIVNNQRCMKDWRWRYSIEDTNGQGPLPELTTLARDRVHKCRCGNMHIIETARYAPAPVQPEQEGWKERWVTSDR